MRQILTPFFLLCLMLNALGSVLHAQSDWRWGRRGGSSVAATSYGPYEQVTDMATDKNGNVYVLSNVYKFINVDGQTRIGYGTSTQDIAVASWSCNGTFRWLKIIGGGSVDFGAAIRTDTLGGVYISGDMVAYGTYGPGKCDTDISVGTTNKTMFLAKYDTAGVYQWLHMPQADTVAAGSPSTVIDMDVAPNGDIYAFCQLAPGNYSGAGGYIVNTQGFYLLKYNASGAFQSGTKVAVGTSGPPGATYNMTQSHFRRDHTNGRFYIGGSYDAIFGSMTFGSTTITHPFYIGGFEPNGNLAWVKQSSSINGNGVLGVMDRPVVDQQGNIYIYGVAEKGDVFNGYTFANSLSTFGYSLPFLIKLNSNGDNIWAVNGSTTGNISSLGAIALTGNTVAITGDYALKLAFGTKELNSPPNTMANVYMAQFNAQTGEPLRLDSLLSTPGVEEFPGSLASDRNGNFFVGGRFASNIIVAGNTLQNIGGETDWFVAKFGSANCNCTTPTASFTSINGTGNAVTFTYNGTIPVDSLRWNFGNGQTATGNTVNYTYPQSGSYNVCVTAYNNCGSNTFCKTVATNGVGITGYQLFDNISIYPNPATNMLHINGLPEEVGYRMYSSVGVLVQQGKLPALQSSIDMSSLSAGWYVVEMQHAEGAKQRVKVVKQ
jgi:hypothetical protein